MAPVLGSRQGFVPCAKATKFATVRGVYLSYKRAVMAPSLVLKIAYNPGFSAGGSCAMPSDMVSRAEKVSAMRAQERPIELLPSLHHFRGPMVTSMLRQPDETDQAPDSARCNDSAHRLRPHLRAVWRQG